MPNGEDLSIPDINKTFVKGGLVPRSDDKGALIVRISKPFEDLSIHAITNDSPTDEKLIQPCSSWDILDNWEAIELPIIIESFSK